jgi:hypothetical protein
MPITLTLPVWINGWINRAWNWAAPGKIGLLGVWQVSKMA